MRFLGMVAGVMMIPSLGMAASVDLGGWIENGYQGDDTAGNWTVQGTGNDSVLQSINTPAPTVFFESGSNAQGTALSGSLTVEEAAGDDDFVGFVLGYQANEFDSASADFWLIDWKQGNQTHDGGYALAGLSLSHVTGDIQNSTSNAFHNGFWNHDVGVVDEKVRATNLGSTGWADNTQYDFEITFTSTLIKVLVNGVEEINYSGTFTDGAFGFYNFSQRQVRYSSIETAAVPLPAALPLLGFGIGLLGFAGRRQRKQRIS